MPSSFRLRIRPLRPVEMPGLLELERACFGPDAYDSGVFRRFLRRHPRGISVAVTAGVLAGYVMWRLVGETCRIDSLAVAPPFRGAGIGARLIHFVLASCQKAGQTACFLEVRAGNRRAIRLYQRFGFRVVARAPGYYDDGETAYRMKRSLADELSAGERNSSPAPKA